jgi:hypothetical protein
VIDTVDAPATASVGAGGNYTISGTVKFHDAEKDQVAKLRIKIPSAGAAGETTSDLPQAAAGQLPAVAVQFSLTLGGTVPKGLLEYDLSLTDDRGAEGATVKKEITLQ